MSLCECGCGQDAGVYANPTTKGTKRFLFNHRSRLPRKSGGRHTHCNRGHFLTTENTDNQGRCKECKVMVGALYKKEHPERRLINARKHMYKLEEDAYNEMLRRQQNRCLICGLLFDEKIKLKKTCIDHDHACCPGAKSCGQCIRGIICYACNTMLGFAKDNSEILQAGSNYLKETQWNQLFTASSSAMDLGLEAAKILQSQQSLPNEDTYMTFAATASQAN